MAIDVLLSGFEPFGGEESNPSWEAVRAAAPRLCERGIEAVALELPVVFERAGQALLAAVREHRPSLVLATGLAAGRTAITPERVAINIRDARIPDSSGAQPVDEPVVPGGPVGLFSTLPIKVMVAAARDVGVPAAVSQTAGTYVCNDVFYALQHALDGDPELAGFRGGFVHVPTADVIAVDRAAEALVAMIERALGTTADLHISGGAEH
ncbi:MAG TPA: pyroglutamyl-peptidase I [Candidatus Brachybacterium merdigallinarum]|nr:pyroglutamyl-peptidase I [Candidatus Brachybacterium merdigallinarum]